MEAVDTLNMIMVLHVDIRVLVQGIPYSKFTDLQPPIKCLQKSVSLLQKAQKPILLLISSRSLYCSTRHH